MMHKKSKIYITGHDGMVGSNLVEALYKKGFNNLIFRTSKELDLRDGRAVDRFFAIEQPDYVFHLAARVGGIMANVERPAEFLFDNIMMTSNVIHNAYKYKVKKLLNLGSSCIYPRDCPQPMKEEYFMTGKLEPTNEGYAIAKISGLKMCEYYNKQYGTNFISLMPSNIYGKYERFDEKDSHVLSAMIMKFYKAMVNQEDVVFWGSGIARREFTYVDDVVEACLYFFENYNASDFNFINIGSGEDVSIKELAEMIGKVMDYKGKIEWDTTKPDGMPKKLVDNSLMLKLGFKTKVSLLEGINKTYSYYLSTL